MIDFHGPDGSLRLFGVHLLGVTPDNGRRFLLTLAVVIVVPLLGWLLNKGLGLLAGVITSRRVVFWIRQTVSLMVAVVVIVVIASIWFDDPSRLTTALGLVTAGVAVALQRVITAIGGYFLILRGRVFDIGDRIVIGGVRGDVVDLGFLQTTVMEMGESDREQADKPAAWVRSRQYTGRIVTVSNAVVFDEPVYNYTRDFPFIFEELTVPIRYGDDGQTAERVMLEAARRHTLSIKHLEQDAVRELRRRYFLDEENPGPRVYWRLTDNWLEMTVRFVVRDHGVRAIKDAMSRDILRDLQGAGISVASPTHEVVRVPPLELRAAPELRT